MTEKPKHCESRTPDGDGEVKPRTSVGLEVGEKAPTSPQSGTAPSWDQADADGSEPSDSQPRAAPASSDRLRALIAQWRAEGRRCESFHATMGTGYTACADELEAVLKEPSDSEPELVGEPEFVKFPRQFNQQITRDPPDADARSLLRELVEEWKTFGDGTSGGLYKRDCADQLAALFPRLDAAPQERQPDFWRCKTCGCLWRDNGPSPDIPALKEGSVSLASAKQTSCPECEVKPTADVCEPLYRELDQPPASRPAESTTLTATWLDRACMKHLDASRPAEDSHAGLAQDRAPNFSSEVGQGSAAHPVPPASRPAPAMAHEYFIEATKMSGCSWNCPQNDATGKYAVYCSTCLRIAEALAAAANEGPRRTASADPPSASPPGVHK